MSTPSTRRAARSASPSGTPHRVHFSGAAVLRRWDCGLTRSTAPDPSGVLGGDGLTLALDVSAVRVDHDAAA
ncbi:hypothetical protein [Streptomyces sp. NPDC016675]|uniref:hypothetical protein n=1 Tax=Streptomyces sp. NPDC016675 TaxID=3364970 RepID=UPI003703266D